jgi:putative membrane protein
VNTVTQVFALLAALIHLVVGTLERFFYDRPAVRLFLTTSTADAPEVTLWRSGVAVYNLLLGLGLVAGVVAVHTGDSTAGRALVGYLCAFMIVSAVVFAVSFPRLWRGALGQGLAPAVALLAAAL